MVAWVRRRQALTKGNVVGIFEELILAVIVESRV